MAALRGITWDHPRGYRGLLHATAAYRALAPDVTITWERHPLRHFEAQPIAELAAAYDLIVLDHPFMGDVAEQQCLVGLQPHAEALDLAGLADDVVGESLASYRCAEEQWALPIDAACQVAAYRPDLLARIGAPPPRTLDEVQRLAGEGRLALALGGVHAFMVFLTLCANHGAPLQAPPGAPLVDEEVGIVALEILRSLAGHCPPEALTWNSIGALEAMSNRDDLLYCPYIFGFSSYSAKSAAGRQLLFTTIPVGSTGDVAGSVLGGTGLAISRRCGDLETALVFARYVTSRPVQIEMGLAGGQPTRRSAWLDASLNQQYANFYDGTLAVIEESWVRPRFAGYVPFQEAAGELVTAYLRESRSPQATLEELATIYRQASAA